MTHSTDDQIPTPPAPEGSEGSSNAATDSSEKKDNTWVWLLVGGLGCGCLGLLGFIGVVVVIALPSFLNQAQNAQESEGRLNVNALVRGQQAYHLESGEFTRDLNELGLGIAAEGLNYTYEMMPQNEPMGSVYITATPRANDGTLRSYAAGVFVVEAADMSFTVAGVCESNDPSPEPPQMPTLAADGETVECPEGSTEAL
ncbi:MAG: type IV pilin-like G/H family protein [Cyanobacteria bacterium P01_G01_bin.54]